MEDQTNQNHRTTAMLIHLFTFGKWFFPFGNFILPLILWSLNSNKSSFIDKHGRSVLNFQLSITLYTIITFILASIIILIVIGSGGSDLLRQFDGSEFPFKQHTGILVTIIAVAIIMIGCLIIISIIDLVYTIIGAINASNGMVHQYPITINFIKSSIESNNPIS